MGRRYTRQKTSTNIKIAIVIAYIIVWLGVFMFFAGADPSKTGSFMMMGGYLYMFAKIAKFILNA